MKKYLYTLVFFCSLASVSQAQDFDKNLAEARKTYAAGDLSNSRFAMEQALRELDLAIGQEMLKLLPTKMENLTADTKNDQVTAASGSGIGLFVHRTYQADSKTATLDIINNSPLITSLNALLAVPFVASMGGSGHKVVKVQGYKAILDKPESDGTTQPSYTLQIPLQNTLVTLQVEEGSEDRILKMANTLPLAKIAQMAN